MGALLCEQADKKQKPAGTSDRGEEDVDAKMFDTANEFMEWFDGGEYWYILGTDGIWYFSEGDPLAWKRVDGAIDWK